MTDMDQERDQPERPAAPEEDDLPNEPVNDVELWLRVVGWLTIGGGVLAGLVVGYGRGHPNWLTGVGLMISAAISSLLFFALAEIIRLLERIAGPRDQ